MSDEKATDGEVAPEMSTLSTAAYQYYRVRMATQADAKDLLPVARAQDVRVYARLVQKVAQTLNDQSVPAERLEQTLDAVLPSLFSVAKQYALAQKSGPSKPSYRTFATTLEAFFQAAGLKD